MGLRSAKTTPIEVVFGTAKVQFFGTSKKWAFEVKQIEYFERHPLFGTSKEGTLEVQKTFL